MNVQQLMESGRFESIAEGNALKKEISGPFCCDLLSVAMSSAPEGCAWVTVMANENTLAVASLMKVACIVLAGGMKLPERAIEKAIQQGITVLASNLPIYETARAIEVLCEEKKSLSDCER